MKDVWYAIMNGKILPVVYHPDTKKYQVSYSDGHFTIPKGTYTFQFFNEAAIGEIRKASNLYFVDLQSFTVICIKHHYRP